MLIYLFLEEFFTNLMGIWSWTQLTIIVLSVLVASE